jgi:hypothetical protein
MLLSETRYVSPSPRIDYSKYILTVWLSFLQHVNVQADHWKVIRKIGEKSATYVAPCLHLVNVLSWKDP